MGVNTFTSFDAGGVAYCRPNELHDVIDAQLIEVSLELAV